MANLTLTSDMALEDASTRTVGENTIQASPAALRCSYTVNSRRGDYSLRKSNNQTNKDRRTHRRHARREGCTLDDTSSSSTTSPAFVIPLQLQTINQTLSMFESWQQNLVECQFYTSASAIPHGLFFFIYSKSNPTVVQNKPVKAICTTLLISRPRQIAGLTGTSLSPGDNVDGQTMPDQKKYNILVNVNDVSDERAARKLFASRKW